MGAKEISNAFISQFNEEAGSGLKLNTSEVEEREEELVELVNSRHAIEEDIVNLNGEKEFLEKRLISLQNEIQEIHELRREAEEFIAQTENERDHMIADAREKILDMSRQADEKYRETRIKIACDARNRIKDEIQEITDLVQVWYGNQGHQQDISSEVHDIVSSVLNKREQHRPEEISTIRKGWLSKFLG